MGLFLIKRAAVLVLSTIAATVVVFTFMAVLPGDPAEIALGVNATPEAVAALRAQFGTDRPLPVQYLDWAGGLLTGDFGVSYVSKTPITPLIADRLAVTCWLVLFSLIISLIIAVPLGTAAAVRHRRISGLILSGVSQAGIAVPAFVAGIGLLVIFAVNLRVLPSGGFVVPAQDPVGFLRHLVLPALSLGLVQGAVISRYIRSAVLDVLREDFLRTARAKGMGPYRALLRHGTRNARHPGDHRARAAGGDTPDRSGGDRAGVHHPRSRQPAAGRRGQPGSAAGAGHRDGAGGRRAGDQLRGRRRLPHPRSPVAGLLMSTTAPARLRRIGPNLIIGAVLVGLVLIIALVSFGWTPHDPTFVDGSARLRPVFDPDYLLGTDKFGRDVFSQLLVGARTTLFVGIVAVGISAVIGTPVGITAGMSGGWPGEAVMRVNDVIFAFPALLLAIMFGAVFGPSTLTAMVAIGIATVPAFARVARGQTMQVMRTEYVLAARAAGRKRPAIALRHVLPNIASMIIVQASVSFAIAILAEAALSFLGFGTPPPTPSWGRMLAESQELLFAAPRLALIPGLAIALAVLGFNLLGDGLRDWLDPRLREVR